MSERELPARPNLEQYKKQAKDLVKNFKLGIPDALTRAKCQLPRFHKLQDSDLRSAQISLSEAQLAIAREHGFESWPKFARHIETLNGIGSLSSLSDPVAAFIEMACVPRHAGHASGTLELAEMILSQYPQVATANIHTAAILGHETAVRGFLSRDPKSATTTGGPHGWDGLTHLCFSRYLRLDQSRSQAFVRTAQALLGAGASANTGWYETMNHPATWESAIYGAAAVAQHAELTRLLLEHGADPNDGETPYHVPESLDHTVMRILLESGKLTRESLSWLLVRKADRHDVDGLQLALEYGADPNLMTRWGYTALHQALRRDNRLKAIELLLDHGADPALRTPADGRSGTAIAARRGRGDVLALLEQRGFPFALEGVDRLIAACAKSDRESIRALVADMPHLADELIAVGGSLLAEFAGTGNVEGLRCLLDLGVSPSALYKEGDNYFEIAKNSTALHVAAWRAWPLAVKELITRGAPVNALDGKGRTALALAVRACVDSYWVDRRSPDSVRALLQAGASVAGIVIPTGYDEIDKPLREYVDKQKSMRS